MESSPENLSISNGEIINFSVKVKIFGETLVYWTIVVLDEETSESTPFIPHPPRKVGIIHPGEKHTFNCDSFTIPIRARASSLIINICATGLSGILRAGKRNGHTGKKRIF